MDARGKRSAHSVVHWPFTALGILRSAAGLVWWDRGILHATPITVWPVQLPVSTHNTQRDRVSVGVPIGSTDGLIPQAGQVLVRGCSSYVESNAPKNKRTPASQAWQTPASALHTHTCFLIPEARG